MKNKLNAQALRHHEITRGTTGEGMGGTTRAGNILTVEDPIEFVGEIRDGETAQIAVQASLTGHPVMPTLHANGAIGAITRLRDIDEFMREGK